MTSSSSLTLERGLDTMLIIYSLLQNHPASLRCEQFIRSQVGWFTSVLNLLEAKAILVKVYGVLPTLASQGLEQLTCGPLVLIYLDGPGALSAQKVADTLALDLTDVVLLQAVCQQKAQWLATEDQHLATVCGSFGITAISPFDPILRQQVAGWESAHVPPKGMARTLKHIHQWLSQTYPSAAQDFWSQSGAGSHLP